MRLSILTYGTRGDVQPYIALGQRLQAAGHSVVLAAPEKFETFVASHGLDFVPLPGDINQLVLELVDGAGTKVPMRMGSYFKFALPLAVKVIEQCRLACEGSDGIIHAFPMNNAGEMIATAKGVPHLGALVLPLFTPTQEFPLPVFGRYFKGWFNQLSHQLFQKTFWMMSKFAYSLVLRPKSEKLLPLGPWPFSPGKPQDVPILYGISSTVLPQPKDWPPDRMLTGYWQLPAENNYQPPQALIDFLKDGPPPIYIGFGSMLTKARKQVESAVLTALKISGQRAIFLGESGEFAVEALPDAVFAIDAVPHDWLFPQMAVIVHHGGAGTTAASLRSGKPTIIVPFTADQPFWGNQVHQLGVGPKPISMKKLTGERLANAIITAVENEDMHENAAELGTKLRREDGLEIAVHEIEVYFTR